MVARVRSGAFSLLTTTAMGTRLPRPRPARKRRTRSSSRSLACVTASVKTENQIKSELDEGYKTGRFKAPAKPGIVYMMSDKIFLFVNNKLVHGPAHLMFYAPYATEKDIGSPPGGRNMPHLIRAGQPDAYIIVIPASS